MPRYVKIAMDIAERIYKGELEVGAKIRGRSTLASQYSVSPETIRRAVSLLSEVKVVKVYEKSGIFIESPEQAYIFLQQYHAKQNFQEIRAKIQQLQQQKTQIEKELNKNIDVLLEYSMSLEQFSSKEVHRITIGEAAPVIGQSIAETQFWKQTNATILSIIRGEQEIISPGPDFILQIKDIVVYICADENVVKVKAFLQ